APAQRELLDGDPLPAQLHLRRAPIHLCIHPWVILQRQIHRLLTGRLPQLRHLIAHRRLGPRVAFAADDLVHLVRRVALLGRQLLSAAARASPALRRAAAPVGLLASRRRAAVLPPPPRAPPPPPPRPPAPRPGAARVQRVVLPFCPRLPLLSVTVVTPRSAIE